MKATPFTEWVQLREMAATGDLVGGYKGGPDWQVEGDPSSMNPQRRERRQKKRKRRK